MDDLFTNRKPTEEQEGVLDAITEKMLEVAELFETLPASRYRSLAFTNLEQASMWAKKGVVFTVGVADAGASAS